MATTARPPRPAAGAGRPDRALWLLLLLALAERLSFLLGSRDRAWPFPIFYEGDAEAFYQYAQAILRGVPYDNGIPFHPPFFPLVLAGLHALLGDPVPHGLLRGIFAVASATCPALLYRLTRESIGRGAALAAGLLAALSFGMDVLGSAATSEGLFLLLALFLLLLAGHPERAGSPGPRRGAVIGLVAGALALTRAEGIFLSLAVATVWLVRASRKAPRSRSRLGVAAALGLLAVLTPWTIRNAVVLHRWNGTTGARIGTHLPTFVPITAYGPLNFALANNEKATGEFQRRLLTSASETAILDLADPQHRHYFLHGAEDGARWIVGHPGGFLRLVGRKLEIWSRAFDLGFTPWDLPHGLTGTRLPVDMFAPDSRGLRYAQLVLAAVGLGLLLRRKSSRGHALLLSLPILASLAATVLFFGYVRLGMLSAFFGFAFEGVAFAALARRLPAAARDRLSRPRVGYVLTGAMIALLLFGAFQDRDYTASGSTDRPGGKLQRDAPVHITPAP